jgi:hypothetical protein
MSIDNKSGKEGVSQHSSRDKTIQKCHDWKKEYLDRKRKPTGLAKPSGFLFPALKILAVLCASAFLLFMVSRAVAGPRSDLSVTVKVDNKNAKPALEKAEQVFKAFKNRDNAEIALLARRLDGHAKHDCEEVIGKFDTVPDFKLAAVKSPKTDPSRFYVTVPSDKRPKADLVLRMVNGDLVLEGICLNQR